MKWLTKKTKKSKQSQEMAPHGRGEAAEGVGFDIGHRGVWGHSISEE